MARSKATLQLPEDPLWYKDAIIYEARVRSFYDSNSDGIGDLRGLVDRLDYIQDLGVTAVWILPFYPSPLVDDGYDIAEYTGVHPDLGRLTDFRRFLREAHKRGLRVIIELVMNHTSDQHPWFRRARQARRGSRYRDYYVWADHPQGYADARIIFSDSETSNWTWDPVAGQYFWHRFYSNQPDLNFDNPQVRRSMTQVLDFWFRMGVDGMRVDAVPYLYEREGTNCENLPETHDYLKALRRHLDTRFRDKMLLAEANQWPEDAVAYFGEGDECHMAFHFPIMPRMFMAIQMEDRYPILDILQETPSIPDNAQWALFLRNHDELTLEMVTDEERDYMYRMYASDPQARLNLGIRRRLAPLLGNNRRKIELMNGLLFSLPGTPVIYYGDEIGMGDNFYLGDRNGVRTPMQWSPDRNAGFSRANPQLLYLPVVTDPEYHYETVNVETQQNNPQSLLWWMKRLIAMRKRFQAFGRGDIRFLTPRNAKVLAFVRTYGEQVLLVVANLSRFVQYVELDLSAYQGMCPVEMFGRNPFPDIGELPYLLTLGPHAFYWFALEPPRSAAVEAPAEAPLPRLQVDREWARVLAGRPRAALEHALPGYIRQRRWFGGKARGIREVRVVDAVAVHPGQAGEARLLLLRVDYSEGDPETYQLPLGFAAGERAEALRREQPQAVIAELQVRGADGTEEGVLHDAVVDPDFCRALLWAILRRRQFRGAPGRVSGVPGRRLRGLRLRPNELSPRVLSLEQSNTSVLYDHRAILKLFRKLEPGENPDLEIGRYLTERRRFANVPATVGHLDYQAGRGRPISAAVLQEYVDHEHDAWRLTLDELSRYYERVQARRPEREPALPTLPITELAGETPPAEALELIGGFLEQARLLGRRTAEMHLALAGDTTDKAFQPEAFSTLYQRSMYQAFRSQAAKHLGTLRKQLPALPEGGRADAERLLEQEGEVLRRFRRVVGRKLGAMRIRCHGDFHLGQVLYTGKDFFIIDFEGEPARPVGERRIKRSPLRDVAGMVRSFDYAAHTALVGRFDREALPTPEFAALEPWATFWQRWVGAAYLQAYLDEANRAAFLPAEPQELALLMELYLLEKAVYELGYELNNRPDWVLIPVEGMLGLLGQPSALPARLTRSPPASPSPSARAPER